MTNNYPSLPLSDDTVHEYLDYARDWALANGFLMRKSDDKKQSDYAQLCPFTLLPTPFPRHCYQLAIDVQKDMNLMYFAAAHDRQFVNDALAQVVMTDEFTKHQLDLYNKVMEHGLVQKIVLQIQRSDYMCHSPDQTVINSSIKQIEVNNIASSFGALASKCAQLHYALLQHEGVNKEILDNHLLRHNQALDTVAGGIAAAWKLHANPSSYILVIIENENQNISDHRTTEFKVNQLTDGQAKFMRLTLAQCHQRLGSDSSTNHELIDQPTKRVISVVYFRAGYVPEHYTRDHEWDARLVIEQSTAIKCPWIGLQLVNTKKVQQVLSGPGQVEKFLGRFYADPQALKEHSSLVRGTFAGMWGFDLEQPQEQLIERVLNNPDNYVLKPQLEGGGRNTYGKDIPPLLKKLDNEQRAAYIVMERIRPLQQKNYLVRSGSKSQSELQTVISELGVYGYLIGHVTDQSVQTNIAQGHVLRTKAIGTDEGGIMAGASCIDSCWLVDD